MMSENKREPGENSPLTKKTIIRAWRDETFRQQLSPQDLAAFNQLAEEEKEKLLAEATMELTDEELEAIVGGQQGLDKVISGLDS